MAYTFVNMAWEGLVSETTAASIHSRKDQHHSATVAGGWLEFG